MERIQAATARNTAQQATLHTQMQQGASNLAFNRAIQEQNLARQGQLATAQRLALERQLSTLYKTAGNQGPWSDANRMRLKEIQSRIAALNSGIAAQAITARKVTEGFDMQEEALGRMNEEMAVLREEEAARSGPLAEQARLMDAQVAKIEHMQRLQQRFRAVTGVGRAAQFTGFIGLAGLGYAANQFAQFQRGAVLAGTQMANTVGGGAKNILAASQVIMKADMQMAGQTTSSMSEMNTAWYHLFSGLPGVVGRGLAGYQKALQGFKIANEAAIASGGILPLTDATNLLIRLMNNFSSSGMTMGQTMNRAFAIVKYGNINMADFLRIIDSIGSSAQGAGQSLNDLASTIALASRHLPAGFVAAGIPRLIQLFSKVPVQEALARQGVIITEWVNGVQKLKPFPEILRLIAQRFQGLTKGGVATTNFFKLITAGVPGAGIGTSGTIQAARVFNVIMRNMQQYLSMGPKIVGTNNAMDASFRAMQGLPAVKWREDLNKLHVAILQLGQAVVPVFTRIIDFVTKAVSWFTKLPAPVRHIIGETAAWSAVTLLLGGTILKLLGSLGQMVLFFRILAGEKGLAGISSEAGIATSAVGRLRLALLGLKALGVIGITIAIGYAIAPYMQRFSRWLGIGAPGQATPRQAAQMVEQGWLKSVQDLYQKRMWFSPRALRAAVAEFHEMTRASLNMSLAADAASKSFHGLALEHARLTGQMAGRGRGAYGGTAVPGVFPGMSKGAFNASLDMLKQLDLAYLNSPSPDAWNAIQNELAQIQLNGSKNQYSYAKKYLTMITAEYKKAGVAQGNAMAGAAGAAVQAQQTMANEVNNIVQRLETVFNNFQQNNEQMFGTPISGSRIMQGPWGQMYQQLAVFNVPVPASLQLRALQTQNQDFANFRKNLDIIKKRSGKYGEALVNELKANPSDITRTEAMGLAQAPQSMLMQIALQYARGANLLKKYSMIDFHSQLQDWASYGKQTLIAILTGMKSQARYLRKGFQAYILSDTLESSIKAWVMKQFPTLFSDAMKAAETKYLGRKGAETAARHGVSPTAAAARTHPVVVAHTTSIVHIHADGDRAADIARTLRKHSFDQKTRTRRNGTTGVQLNPIF
jgi:hypothetical protein